MADADPHPEPARPGLRPGEGGAAPADPPVPAEPEADTPDPYPSV